MLLLDKPEGPTSHDAVAAVRRTLGVRRAGHTGTLDPFASGLLVILVGRATRLARFVSDLPKGYTGVIALGTVTDTDDRTGTVLERSETWRDLDAAALNRAARGLGGRVLQRPPAYSAKKIAGRRAYRLARAGTPLALAPREVQVHEFTVGSRQDTHVPFDAAVSGGTYIRALARDLGEALGCGAHLHALRRTAVGPFRVEDAVPLDALGSAPVPLRPPREAVAHLPAVQVSAEDEALVSHGRPLPTPASPEQPNGPVAVLRDDELVAVAERRGDVLAPRIVLSG